MATTEPTVAEAVVLFQELEQRFPSTTLGGDRWYILAISAVAAGGHPNFAADLYTYVISKPEYSTADARKALMRRLREALLKLVSVVGVPKPLEAIFSIAAVEKPEDRDMSFSRETWQSGPENLARGRNWLSQIYRHNHAATENVLAAHKDFMWISEEITYGLYLSDHSIIGPVETELVVLTGIMMQNLVRETGWHLRGIRRIGVSMEDVEVVQQCIERVAAFCGLALNRVPRVADIEHEVPFDSGA
ncbi:unnamed protein product [Zymoseptoria tritici ST99CH_3D1]|uniref:Carboxymuconolactone decarboxylase-like domain-containing protein n=2 Tax=Zymoseptoria tritici TaxID=1047171 RepID=A0A1X7S7F2_ZYMT9|nr:unnamed protein product [Zymoseptoria tritici ST99CH_3D7]SMR60759.1 unnamed protein product [Zymoseptoria tritici ST99CH_1E4]SMR63891.1 unnamed protein product [Zymoseptoria tritici ST99CH_3D1]